MTAQPETAGSPAYYDGVLSRPFLAEHWYRGFVAALLSLFLLTLLFYSLLDDAFLPAILLAGVFSLTILIAVVTQHQRFELSFTRRQYRSSLWILGLRFGEWQPLPPIDFVKIRHWQQQYVLPMSDDSDIPLGFTAIEDKWQVLLHASDSPVGLVAAYVGQAQARRIAGELASLLHVEIRS